MNSKKNIIVLFFIVILVLGVVGFVKLPKGNFEQTVSKPTLVIPGTCFAFQHELGYEPYDVHVWINESTGKFPGVYQAYTNWSDGEITLVTSFYFVTVCNMSLESFIALVFVE